MSISDKFIANMELFIQEIKDSIITLYDNNPSFKKSNNLYIDKSTFDAIEMSINSFVKSNDKLKDKIIREFIENSSQIWDKVKERNIKFLVELIDVVFPHLDDFDHLGHFLGENKTLKDYINNISFFFGRNKEGKMYFNDQEMLDYLWDILDGMISLSIKYIISTKYQPKCKFNLDEQIKVWNIKN